MSFFWFLLSFITKKRVGKLFDLVAEKRDRFVELLLNRYFDFDGLIVFSNCLGCL